MEPGNTRKSLTLKTNAQINEFERTWVIKNFGFRQNYPWDYENAAPMFTFYNNQEKYELQLRIYSKNYRPTAYHRHEDIIDYMLNTNNERKLHNLQLALDRVSGPTEPKRAYVQLSFIFNDRPISLSDGWLIISPEEKRIVEGNLPWTVINREGYFTTSKDLTMKLLICFDNGDQHEENYSDVTSTICEKSVINDLKSLLTSSRFSDVKLVVANKEFPVHKAILATRSSVFSAMFQHDMLENRMNVVEIPDVEPEAMSEMLRYIYTGSVKDIELLTPNLMIAADKYDLGDLSLACQRALMKSLNVANLTEILKLVDKLEQYHPLRDSVMKFITSHGQEVTNMNDFDEILESSSTALLHEVIKALGQRP